MSETRRCVAFEHPGLVGKLTEWLDHPQGGWAAGQQTFFSLDVSLTRGNQLWGQAWLIRYADDRSWTNTVLDTNDLSAPGVTGTEFAMNTTHKLWTVATYQMDSAAAVFRGLVGEMPEELKARTWGGGVYLRAVFTTKDGTEYYIDLGAACSGDWSVIDAETASAVVRRLATL